MGTLCETAHINVTYMNNIKETTQHAVELCGLVENILLWLPGFGKSLWLLQSHISPPHIRAPVKQVSAPPGRSWPGESAAACEPSEGPRTLSGQRKRGKDEEFSSWQTFDAADCLLVFRAYCSGFICYVNVFIFQFWSRVLQIWNWKCWHAVVLEPRWTKIKPDAAETVRCYDGTFLHLWLVDCLGCVLYSWLKLWTLTVALLVSVHVVLTAVWAVVSPGNTPTYSTPSRSLLLLLSGSVMQAVSVSLGLTVIVVFTGETRTHNLHHHLRRRLLLSQTSREKNTVTAQQVCLFSTPTGQTEHRRRPQSDDDGHTEDEAGHDLGQTCSQWDVSRHTVFQKHWHKH